MSRILLVGATGLVGRHVLSSLLADDRVDRVVTLTRYALSPHQKLVNPVVDFSQLPEDAEWWNVDGAICTLGTTRARAGSDQAFWQVDHDYPLAVARLAQRHGATRFALTSAMGADARSRFLYMRTKGTVENDLRDLHFSSLTLVRPGLIGGSRDEFRLSERIGIAVLSAVGPLLPRRYRISPATRIAEVLVEAAMDGKPGCHIVEADQLAVSP